MLLGARARRGRPALSAPDPTPPRGPAPARLRSGPGPRALLRAQWLPVLLAPVFLLVLLLTARQLIGSVYADPDAVSVLTISDLLPLAPPDRIVILGNYTWYEPLWMLLATRGLPAHRQLWEALPFGLWALTLGALWLGVRRVAGRWSAWTVAAVLLCLGSVGRAIAASYNFHFLAVTHAAVLALGLTQLVRSSVPRARRVLLAVALGLISALGATDPVFLVVGALPFGVAGLATAGRRRERPLAGLVLLTGGLTLAGGALLGAAGHSANIFRDITPLILTPGDRLAASAGLFVSGLGRLVAGFSLGERVTLWSGLALIGLLVAAALVLLGARFARGQLEAGWRERAADPARFALTAFWATSAVAGLALFLIASTASGGDFSAIRYSVSVWVGTVVVLSLGARTPAARRVVGGLAGVVCLIALASMIHSPGPNDGRPLVTGRQIAAIEAFAREQGVTRGYAPYYDAGVITWGAHERVLLYPIQPCPVVPTETCPFYLDQISSWYIPQAGRTLLVSDPRQADDVVAKRRYGRPLARRRIDGLTVYVYRDDIARHFAGPPGHG